MITCVSLNPSIDRTLAVERLEQGGLNRVLSQTDVAAGKGVNVALAASALGMESACIGFMYAQGAELFEERLTSNGIGFDFVREPGAVRVNMKIMDRARGEITELNAAGVPVTAGQLDAMRVLVRSYAARSEFMVFSGSLPPDCPADYYQTLAAIAREAGCRVLLDADGARLRAGLTAKPFLIKPNRYELEQLVGHSLNDDAAILSAARELVRGGVGVVAVSLGSEGALITDGAQAIRAKGMKVEVRSTVAAGDSMLAGLAAGFERGYDLCESFRLGVAAATARCMTPPEETITAQSCRELAEKIELEALE